MTKDTVTYIRNLFATVKNNSGNPAPLSVVADNLKLFDEQYMVIFWDDEHEIMFATRAAEKIYGQTGNRVRASIETVAVAYDQIQYITVAYTGEKLLASDLPATFKMPNELVAKLISLYNPSDKDATRNIMTPEQIEALKPDQEWIKAQYDLDHVVKPKIK